MNFLLYMNIDTKCTIKSGIGMKKKKGNQRQRMELSDADDDNIIMDQEQQYSFQRMDYEEQNEAQQSKLLEYQRIQLNQSISQEDYLSQSKQVTHPTDKKQIIMQFLHHKNKENLQEKVIFEILSQQYANFQNLLIERCKMNIQKSTPEENRIVTLIILNCIDRFDGEIIKIMEMLIKMNLQLDLGIEISDLQLIKLYREVKIQRYREQNLKKIKWKRQDYPKRFPRKRYIPSENTDDKVWTKPLQMQMLGIFENCQSFSRVRDLLKLNHYHLNYSWFDLNMVKSRFDKIVRQSMKRLQGICGQKQRGLPKLTLMFDDRIKTIQKSSDALEIRLNVIQLHRNYENQEAIKKTILSINKYFKNKTYFPNKSN